MSAAINAEEIEAQNLVILHPMVDEAEKGQISAQGSIEIRNYSAAADKLFLIVAEFAERAEPASSQITILPRTRTVIPIVFRMLYRKLSASETYYGLLFFERAGKIKIEFTVHSNSRRPSTVRSCGFACISGARPSAI
jgi:copper(I)-binding protein